MRWLLRVVPQRHPWSLRVLCHPPILFLSLSHGALRDSWAASAGLMGMQHGGILGSRVAPERVWASGGDLER